MLGGGMRQAGILAAAGSYALDHHIPRLAEDHDNAARLATGLARNKQLDVAPAQTNMVFVNVAEDIAAAFAAHLAAAGVMLTGTTRQRWVTHLDVTAADVDKALASVAAFFERQR
jgi:threonine aldolase